MNTHPALDRYSPAYDPAELLRRTTSSRCVCYGCTVKRRAIEELAERARIIEELRGEVSRLELELEAVSVLVLEGDLRAKLTELGGAS